MKIKLHLKPNHKTINAFLIFVAFCTTLEL